MEFPAIQVRNLKKSFQKRAGFLKKSRLWALDDVSFQVHKGETEFSPLCLQLIVERCA